MVYRIGVLPYRKGPQMWSSLVALVKEIRSGTDRSDSEARFHQCPLPVIGEIWRRTLEARLLEPETLITFGGSTQISIASGLSLYAAMFPRYRHGEFDGITVMAAFIWQSRRGDLSGLCQIGNPFHLDCIDTGILPHWSVALLDRPFDELPMSFLPSRTILAQAEKAGLKLLPWQQFAGSVVSTRNESGKCYCNVRFYKPGDRAFATVSQSDTHSAEFTGVPAFLGAYRSILARVLEMNGPKPVEA